MDAVPRGFGGCDTAREERARSAFPLGPGGFLLAASLRPCCGDVERGRFLVDPAVVASSPELGTSTEAGTIGGCDGGEMS